MVRQPEVYTTTQTPERYLQTKEPVNRKSFPSNPNINFRFGVDGQPRREKSYDKQSIKLGAQGFPDTEYQPTLMDEMDKQEGNMYKMDMNMFPELFSEFNAPAKSELPDRQGIEKGSKIYMQP